MKDKQSTMTGIIFAGGKSSRMGFDKALAIYKGKPMISYSIELLKPFCDRILISSNDPAHDIPGYERIADIYTDAGPMGGLISCLLQSKSQGNICLPCDVPEMSAEIIQNLINNFDKTSCVVPVTPFPEPLIAIYPLEVIPVIEELVKNKKYQMTGIFDHFKVRYIPFTAEGSVTPFANINKPGDIKLDR